MRITKDCSIHAASVSSHPFFKFGVIHRLTNPHLYVLFLLVLQSPPASTTITLCQSTDSFLHFGVVALQIAFARQRYDLEKSGKSNLESAVIVLRNRRSVAEAVRIIRLSQYTCDKMKAEISVKYSDALRNILDTTENRAGGRLIISRREDSFLTQHI